MNRMLRPSRPVFTFVFVLTMLLGFAGSSIAHPPPAARAATSGCQLNSAKGNIQHVIYVQFDNTHFTRDNPNVPSDLEQMPHLLNFMRDNGVVFGNDHTALISHTATGILTSLTGVYPDRMGQPVSNSFRYFKTDGTTRTGVSFAYWTAPLFDPAGSTTDTTPEMINENGKIAPAPWVPFTRAGCDFGAVATANTILENTAIDIPTVFGAGSPEAQEVASNPGQAFADFVGIGVHCAQGSSVCTPSNHARPDLLRTYLERTHRFVEGGWRPHVSVAEPAMYATGRTFAAPDLGRLQVPVLILYGANSRLCGPEGGRRVQAAIPGSALVEVPDAGHLVLLNQPEFVYEQLARFCAPELERGG